MRKNGISLQTLFRAFQYPIYFSANEKTLEVLLLESLLRAEIRVFS